MHIFIHSKNRLFGECLAAGLRALADVETAEFVPIRSDLMNRVLKTQRPNVLVDLQTADAGDIAQRVRAIVPQACILVLAVDDQDPEAVVDCARKGFAAFVPRDAPVEAVPEYVRKARRGEVNLSPRATASLLRALAEPQNESAVVPPDVMTRREREICMLVCDGLTNKEIARELDRSVGTVKNHIHAILFKLDVPRRGAIASRVMQAGVGVESEHQAAR